MHMVVGFLLAALLRKKNRMHASLPSIAGKLEVVHALPGRLRLRSPLLESAQDGTRNQISTELCHIEGIRSADVGDRSGSLLIGYDASRIEAFVIHGVVIKMLGLEAELERPPTGWLTRELKMVGHSIDRQIHQASAGVMDLRSSLLVTVFVLALYRFLIQGDRALPGSINLLWWTTVLAQRE